MSFVLLQHRADRSVCIHEARMALQAACGEEASFLYSPSSHEGLASFFFLQG